MQCKRNANATTPFRPNAMQTQRLLHKRNANVNANATKRKRKRIKKVETPAPNAAPGNVRPGNNANKGPKADKPEISASDIQKEI